MRASIPPSPLSFSQIEALASRIARDYNFDPESSDVREFVKSIGGQIETLADPDSHQLESGSLVVISPQNFCIYLSPFTGRLRDNFTIAHETGHYFLHSGNPPGSNGIRIGRFGDDLLERQANRFAAALLMPRGRFLEVADLVNDDVTVLAGRFNVSPRAAEVRLQSLGRNVLS